MQTTAYLSSNPARKAELDAQVETFEAQILEAKAAQRRATDKAEVKLIKAEIKRLEAERDDLRRQYPEQLFSEANAINDLECDIRETLDAWEEARREWAEEARYDPTYAIEHADDIVSHQARTAQIINLRDRWQALAESEGRTLTTFRKALDAMGEARRREALAKLTSYPGSNAFRNAVQIEQGRALAQYNQDADRIQFHLTWYERDAAKLNHAA